MLKEKVGVFEVACRERERGGGILKNVFITFLQVNACWSIETASVRKKIPLLYLFALKIAFARFQRIFFKYLYLKMCSALLRFFEIDNMYQKF